jgi:hypothetical protein
MQTETIAFAPFEAHHLDGAVASSREAGWPHRKEDWAMIWSLSEGRSSSTAISSKSKR